MPDYLRGRPRTVIKHCLVRKRNSNKFTAEAIQTTEKPGVFQVVKASGGKHTVDFGAALGRVLHRVHAKTGQGGTFLANISLLSFE